MGIRFNILTTVQQNDVFIEPRYFDRMSSNCHKPIRTIVSVLILIKIKHNISPYMKSAKKTSPNFLQQNRFRDVILISSKNNFL